MIWEDRVKRMHKDRGTMLQEDAMLFYLSIAQRDIPEFGNEFFIMRSQFGKEQWLGVGPQGIHFHEMGQILGSR